MIDREVRTFTTSGKFIATRKDTIYEFDVVADVTVTEEDGVKQMEATIKSNGPPRVVGFVSEPYRWKDSNAKPVGYETANIDG